MAGRTIILVSHAVGLVLPKADYIVVLRNGTISSKGTPLELSTGDHLQGVVSDEVLARGPEAFMEETESSLNSNEETDSLYSRVVETKNSENTRKDAGKLVQDEEKSTGSVRLKVYWSYFNAAGGIRFIVIFVLSYLMIFASDFAYNWWLKQWSDAGSAVTAATGCPNHNNSFIPGSTPALFYNGGYNEATQMSPSPFLSTFMTLPNLASSSWTRSFTSNTANIFLQTAPEIPKAVEPVDVLFYIKYYALFGFLVMIANNFNLIVQLIHGIRAARNLHSKLLDSVLGSPMRFFETTPIGRILNRFSKDVNGCDMSVMGCLGFFVQSLFRMINILVIVTFATPLFLLFITPTLVLYYYVAKAYLNTSRELKRLESVTRSPIYGQFSETLAGASTIRAYGHEERFTKQARDRVDTNHRSFFYLWASNRWLCLRTDMISSCVVFIAGFAVLNGKLSAGWAGLTLTYSLDFTSALLVHIFNSSG